MFETIPAKFHCCDGQIIITDNHSFKKVIELPVPIGDIVKKTEDICTTGEVFVLNYQKGLLYLGCKFPKVLLKDPNLDLIYLFGKLKERDCLFSILKLCNDGFDIAEVESFCFCGDEARITVQILPYGIMSLFVQNLKYLGDNSYSFKTRVINREIQAILEENSYYVCTLFSKENGFSFRLGFVFNGIDSIIAIYNH